MKKSQNEKYVIALGGSIAFPEKLKIKYFRKFHCFLQKEIKKGRKFVIVCGGGYTGRKYQAAVGKITRISNEDRDWIGIHSTRLNAHFLRTVFKKESEPVVIDERFKFSNFKKKPVIIASGWQPGWSTDYVAVQTAADFNIRNVIILGRPDYVYTKDFEKSKSARPIKYISWQEYLKIIPTKWTPGLHAPVDPVAARLAKKEKLKVVVADGEKLDNLKKILNSQKFKGTTIV